MESSLDRKIIAVCEECLVKKITTHRTLKNKWPVCSRCKQSMKIKKDPANADTDVPATNRMDNA